MDKKVIVGIVPQITTKNDNIMYNDRNEFVEVYSKKIKECGATTIGLLANDNKIDEETLELCDAFLIQGGLAIKKPFYDVINYAITHNKPLLGICLGMQAIGIYSLLVNDSNKFSREEFDHNYAKFKEDHNGMLKKVEDSEIIHNTFINNDTYKESFHTVNIIDKDSILYDIYRKDVISESSLHNYTIYGVGNEFKVTAVAPDNTVEAIEFKDPKYFILGLQYHPELEDENLVFKRFIEEGIKRKYE